MIKQGRRYIQCPDRMCGADDCPRCRPENFRGGVYLGDIAEEGEGEATEQVMWGGGTVSSGDERGSAR